MALENTVTAPQEILTKGNGRRIKFVVMGSIPSAPAIDTKENLKMGGRMDLGRILVKMDLSQGPSGKMMKSKLRWKTSTEMRKQKLVLSVLLVRKKIYVNFNVAKVFYMFLT
jgi:hypothetical protein